MASNLTPGSTPGYGGSVAGARESGAFSGTSAQSDPTNEPGQYPGSLFGVSLPQGTGAPGTAGASPGSADPTNQPGQLSEGLSGEGPAQIADTGAPGSQGAQNSSGGGPDTIHYTRAGSYLSGTYQQDTVSDSISGPGDWTQAIDGAYAGGGPQLPGIKGNEPTSTGAGDGRVMRGGRSVS
jgi:hypothetical protein